MPEQMFKEEIRTVKKEEGTIEEDMEQFIKLSNPKNTVYVMHAPPYETKLDIINDLYTVHQHRLETIHAEMLEMTIIILIAMEIILALYRN